jgi:hypothetical protein
MSVDGYVAERDVRLGGGASTIQQYVRARLIFARA